MAQGIETNMATKLPEVRLSRVFPAPRATLFKAWSSADHVKRWFCPAGYSVPDAKVQMHVGGPFEVCMRSPEGIDYWSRGRFTEVTPFERLAIEMDATGEGDHRFFTAKTLVTFADDLGGTRMDVAQIYTLHDPAGLQMIQGAPVGWSQTLDRLEAEVTRIQAENDGVRSVVHATFRLERTYDAPVARVWSAITDEQAKAKWFDARDGAWELLERQIDVRVGGRERLKGRWKGGVVSCFDAVYHDVVPNERIVYAYEMSQDDKKISISLATMQLKAEGGKTKLTVTEQGAFLDGYDDAGSREHGTGFLLDALGASLTR